MVTKGDIEAPLANERVRNNSGKNWLYFTGVALILGAWFLHMQLDVKGLLQFLGQGKEIFGAQSIIWFSLLYIIILAMPFLPGLEFGVCVMFMFGAEGIVFIYLSTIISLSFCFLMGKRIDLKSYFPFITSKAQNVLNFDNLPQRIRQSFLFKMIINYKEYYVLIALLNFPGNALIGGGSGIALLYSQYSKMKYFHFISTVAIATLPLPLMLFTGLMGVEYILHR